MADWIMRRVTLLTGIVALLAGAIIAVIGLVIYRSSMTENLLASFFDLLIGIAVAALFVDRINRATARRQWLSAYEALHGILAATFVDVMRLLNVRSSTRIYQANRKRYYEFVGIATLHASGLQSTIEGFAIGLDPEVHALCRKVEQRLAWMIRSLSADPGTATIDQDQFVLMAATAKILASFIAKEKDRRFTAALQAAENALIACGFPQANRGRLGPEELMEYRLPAQDYMLKNNRPPLPALQTIAHDIDNELAIYYFALDQAILSAVELAR